MSELREDDPRVVAVLEAYARFREACDAIPVDEDRNLERFARKTEDALLDELALTGEDEDPDERYYGEGDAGRGAVQTTGEHLRRKKS